MQWFKIPPKIYFERGAIQYLANMPNISRAFIVTDKTMMKLGYVDKATYYLRKRKDIVHFEIYDEVEPDPSLDTINKGVDAMNNFQPDVIIAIGGGSAIDAAKCMWLFYENPDTSFGGLRLKFMDIRKRAFHFPNLGKKAQMVAVPTTSGTGSEVTSFSVVTDKKNGNIKYPLADYELTPDVAIIDPQFAATMPKSITADTGMDVLTHAIEAFVSVMASDYTNGLAIKAIELVFKYLVRSYNNPEDKTAREKMHNASCIAGMAFSNAFLGINHSLAHKVGGEFHVPHGRANAILLPPGSEHEQITRLRLIRKHPTGPPPEHLGGEGHTRNRAGVGASVESLLKPLDHHGRQMLQPLHLPHHPLLRRRLALVVTRDRRQPGDSGSRQLGNGNRVLQGHFAVRGSVYPDHDRFHAH